MAKRKYNDEENDFLRIVSENIPYYRKKAKKSQGDVAKDIGWELKNYRKIEKARLLSSGLIYKKVAASLKIKVDELYFDRNKQ